MKNKSTNNKCPLTSRLLSWKLDPSRKFDSEHLKSCESCLHESNQLDKLLEIMKEKPRARLSDNFEQKIMSRINVDSSQSTIEHKKSLKAVKIPYKYYGNFYSLAAAAVLIISLSLFMFIGSVNNPTTKINTTTAREFEMPESVATACAIKGMYQVKSSSAPELFQIGYQDKPVFPGEQIISGQSAWIKLELIDKTVIELQPESAVIIDKSQIKLLTGGINISSNRKPGDSLVFTDFIINSDRITMVGTKFFISKFAENFFCGVMQGEISINQQTKLKSGKLFNSSSGEITNLPAELKLYYARRNPAALTSRRFYQYLQSSKASSEASQSSNDSPNHSNSSGSLSFEH